MRKDEFQFHFYQPKALIKVTGDDAFTFLQGQFTNELRQPLGSVTYGLWLNQKGRVLADSQVLRLADNEFLLLSDTSAAGVIMQRLEQYIIADDVILADETEKTGALILWGGECTDRLTVLLGTSPDTGKFFQKDEILSFQGRRIKGSYQMVGPKNIIAEWRSQLIGQDWVEVPADTVELARISSGIPAIPEDIGPTDLPNEAGLEITAISYTKGCYLGQEVMARLKNLGQVRRQLRNVRGTGAAPKITTPLFQGNKKVGEIRSAVSTEEGFIALAMLTRMGLDENAGFSFDAAEPAEQKISIWMS